MRGRGLPLLLLAACLCLTACGGAPAATPAATPTPTAEPAAGSTGVYTDWSGLTASAAPAELYTRAGAAPLDRPVTGDHGLVLPFEGERLYTTSGWQAGGRWGLVTAAGCIVLDPVCTGIRQLFSYDYNTHRQTGLALYALEILVQDPAAPADDYAGGRRTRYALCALDGSWCTDFLFTGIYAAPMGAVCCLDETARDAVCYDEDGQILFDTRGWAIRDQLDRYAAFSLGGLSEPWAPLPLADGGWLYVDRSGQVLDTDQDGAFEGADVFSEGLAAACSGGLWGYIDEAGAWAIPPQYDYTTPFLQGRALVTDSDGTSLVLDRTGQVLHSFAGQTYREGSTPGRYCYYSGSSCLYDEDFQPITVAGQNAQLYYGLGFYAETEAGVVLATDGGELLFPGASQIIGGGDFYLVAMWAGRQLALDRAQRTLLELPEGLLVPLEDRVGGETYIAAYPPDGSLCTVYAADGTRLATQCSGVAIGGLFQCRDSSTSGWKNGENQWIFRVRVDAGD